MRASARGESLAFTTMILIFLGVGMVGVVDGQCLPPCICPDCHVVSTGVCEFVGVPCDLTFTLEGCSSQYTVWSEVLALPPGVHFVGGQGFHATVSGVPTTPGTFSFDVDASLVCLYHEDVTIDIAPVAPDPLTVDANAVTGSSSNTNGLLEPGETIQVDPSWANFSTVPQTFTGTASNLTGPPGPTYTINDSSADYGTVSAGATADCNSATGNCYLMTVSGARPAPHWDAAFTEQLSLASITRVRTMHVGASFPDVPISSLSYAFIENLFHNGVTAGCSGGNYCPDSNVTRAQMAVFLLKGKWGGGSVMPPCGETLFADEPCPGGPFVDWVNPLVYQGITGGCGGNDYCPEAPVTRGQMAVFLLKGAHAIGYVPPTCSATVFEDVPCPGGQFVDFINELAAEGITGGCGGSNYCPNEPVTRGEMAVFLVKTFGLQLYGP